MVKKDVVTVRVNLVNLSDPDFKLVFTYTILTDDFYNTLFKYINHDVFYHSGVREIFDISSIEFLN